jgi:hypothetical protein
VTPSAIAQHFRKTQQEQNDLRLELQCRALQYYDGEADPPLVVKKGEPNDNVCANFSQLIVDTGVEFLVGEGIGIDLGKEGNEGPEDEYLEKVWPEAQRCEDLIDLATNGGIFGHQWVKLSIQPDGSPKVTILDPMAMAVVHDPRDFRVINEYWYDWIEDDGNFSSKVYREITTRTPTGWVIQDHEVLFGDNVRPIGPAISWNRPFAPIFQCKNLPKSNEFYGRPDLSRDVLSLIYYLHRADSLIARILRIHGYPKTVAKGMQAADLQTDITGVLFVSKLESEIKNLEMQSDLSAAMAFRKILRESLAEVSAVPEITTGKTENIGQLSGRALQILYGPLLKRTARKQKLFGRLLTDVVRAILSIGGYDETTKINLQWPTLVPGDPKEDREVALLDKELGVSQDTLLKKFGYDPERERKQREADREEFGNQALAAFDRQQSVRGPMPPDPGGDQ